MQKQTYIFLILILGFLVSCQKPKKKLSVSQYDPTAKNFSFLKEALKDVRILAIGESSHGFGSMHTLKSNLVQYLHRELGFDVLVMEAGFGDIGIAWYNGYKFSPKQLLNNTINSNLRSEQILPLFEYISENRESENPLEFGGMDSRISGTAFKFRLMDVIKRLEPKIIQDSIQNGLKDYNKTFEVLDNEEEWQRYMDSYLSAIDLAKSILQESREDIKELEIVEDKEVDILERYLNTLADAVDYNFGEVYTRGLSLRDSLMAENVYYFAKEEFPKSKIIVWGHNGHIEKTAGEGDNMKWMGHYLKERFGNKYYALGMYAKRGIIYQTSAKKTSNFDIADPSFIEAKIDKDYGKNVYLDLPLFDEANTSWVNRLIFGYELEAGGKVNFVPSKRFDGVLLLGETAAPKYFIDMENSGRKPQQ